MNRQEFFRRLEYLLRGIPENERMDALAYYNDYFDDAGVENEQQVIRELGSPEAVAQMILEDYQRGQQASYGDYLSPEVESESTYEKQQYSHEEKKGGFAAFIDKIKNMNSSTKILAIIVLVFTFPIWIGVAVGLLGAVVGILGGLAGVIIGIGGSAIGTLVGGLIMLVVGILRLMMSPVEGVITIGVGALFTAISVLLVLLFATLAFKLLPTLVRSMTKWSKGLWKNQEGGDEI